MTKASQASPFWQSDRHRKAVYNQFTGGTAPFDFTKNWKFTILNNENVWAKAMNRVVSEKIPVDKAVDELIARLKEVAGQSGSDPLPREAVGRVPRRVPSERVRLWGVSHDKPHLASASRSAFSFPTLATLGGEG